MQPSKDREAFMRIIGITGGVGAGKTAILSYIAKKYNCRVIMADEAAHQVKKPGTDCFRKLTELLSEDILKEDGSIHKEKMAARIFSSLSLLKQVNEIIHPAVKELILTAIEEEMKKNQLDFLFIEAALLIEDGYLNIADELWYIYAKEEIRRRRLKESRAYTDEKIDAIMEKQLTEEEFRKHCRVVIDNSGTLVQAYEQIDRKLGEYLWQK